MAQQYIYILCGLPGSGKSTWCRKKVGRSKKTVILNKDSLRTMIRAKYVFDLRYEPLIRNFASKMLTTSLRQGFHVIIDETNIKKKARTHWVNIARESGMNFKAICVWCTESNRNVEFRANNLRGVPKDKWADIINGMAKTFEKPTLSEGFDSIEKFAVP